MRLHPTLLRMKTVVLNVWTPVTVCLLLAGGFHVVEMRAARTDPSNIRVIGDVGRQLAARADRTLVILVRDGCQFCAASMPFYRDLIARRTTVPRQAAPRIATLILNAGQPQAFDYVRRHRLSVDEVGTLNASQQARLNVRGTPTLLLVDRSGAILARWLGRLTPDTQQAVLGGLFPPSLSRGPHATD